MLLGMIAPSEGAASILGTRVRADAPDLWARVGYLVETPYAYPELTVRENLEVVRRLRRVADPLTVGRIIEQLSLSAYADHRAGTLSLGNAQRLGLAKALLHGPRVLLLDEPANGLDPAGVVEVRQLLRELADEHGVTVFMSSHILSEFARMATRIGILHAGRLKLERHRRHWLTVDARDRVVARAALLAHGFAVDTAEDGVPRLAEERATAEPDAVVRLLVEAGVAPTRLGVEHEDLEEYFLRLVGAEREEEKS